MMFDSTTNAACTSTADFSLDDCLRVMKEMKASRDESERKIDESLKRAVCGVCGRTPKMVRGSSGEVMRVCRHIWKELQKLSRPDIMPQHPPTALTGIRIEVCELDRPIRDGVSVPMCWPPVILPPSRTG